MTQFLEVFLFNDHLEMLTSKSNINVEIFYMLNEEMRDNLHKIWTNVLKYNWVSTGYISSESD